jgi:5-methylcytosine-specific restriction endonuclease McrA
MAFKKGHKINLGRIFTEKHKQNLKLTRAKQVFSLESIKKRNEAMSKTSKGKHYSIKTEFKKGQCSGKNNSAWKGGLTPILTKIRQSSIYKLWRQDVFIRDDFTCKECDKKGGELEAHHRKPFYKLIEEVKTYLPLLNLYDGAMLYTPLWDLDNGITLCKKCHKEI